MQCTAKIYSPAKAGREQPEQAGGKDISAQQQLHYSRTERAALAEGGRGLKAEPPLHFHLGLNIAECRQHWIDIIKVRISNKKRGQLARIVRGLLMTT